MEIEMTEAKSFEPVSVPDDVYAATIVHVEEKELKYGLSLIIGFQIVAPGNYNMKIVEGVCSAGLNDKTKLYQWIQALGLNMKIGEKLETNTLVGASCRIVTEVENKVDRENKPFNQSKVVKVLPLAEEIKIGAQEAAN